MVSSSHDDHAEPALLLAMRNSQDLAIALSIEEQEKEYCLRLRNLQQCICDLLVRNQQLRMALMKPQGNQHGGEDNPNL